MVRSPKFLYNILHTVSTQQRQYSNIMYATGYIVATSFDRKRSSFFIIPYVP